MSLRFCKIINTVHKSMESGEFTHPSPHFIYLIGVCIRIRAVCGPSQISRPIRSKNFNILSLFFDDSIVLHGRERNAVSEKDRHITYLLMRLNFLEKTILLFAIAPYLCYPFLVVCTFSNNNFID